MISLSNLSLSHIATISSHPIPQFTTFGGSCIPNIQINSMISSIIEVNRFIIPLPPINNIVSLNNVSHSIQPIKPKLDISHCKPIHNDNDGPPLLFELNKSDPAILKALKSHHNAINEAVFDTNDPLHPLLYPVALKTMNDMKAEIDKFCE